MLKDHFVDLLKMHESSVFMVSCMDFRFVGRCERTMHELGYCMDYDSYAVAGATLGLTC